jgi:hygromycin-B 4-O-kinase
MAKPLLADSTIQAALQERWGEISAFERLAEGLDSQTYGFRHNDSEYVARINQSSCGFQKDAFVYRRFASPTLPIPEIVDIARLDDGHAVCVSRRAAGVRVHDLASAELPGIIGSIREILTAISGSDLAGTSGFGRFDARGSGPHDTWRDFLTSVADPRRLDWEDVGPDVDRAAISAAIGLVEALAERCPEERGLVHGDFGSYNLMTDRHRITAVIDWDRALFGDPLYEIANLLFWGEQGLEPLTLGSSTLSDDEPRRAERLLCYQLRVALQEIYESATGETSVDLGWLTTRCKHLVDQARGRLQGPPWVGCRNRS